jgi:hypothetical protein
VLAVAWLARLRREIKRGVGCVVSAAAVSHVLLCQGRVPWMFCCFRWLGVGDLENETERLCESQTEMITVAA